MKTIKIYTAIFLSLLIWGCNLPPRTGGDLSNPAAADTPLKGQDLPVTASFKVGDQTIELEVARTPEQMETGLMYRSSLPENRGMLFNFPTPRLTRFWMKNVFISLDMLFLKDGEIKEILPNVPPCKSDPCPIYGPDTLVDQVIELPGGRAARLGLKPGDKIRIVPR